MKRQHSSLRFPKHLIIENLEIRNLMAGDTPLRGADAVKLAFGAETVAVSNQANAERGLALVASNVLQGDFDGNHEVGASDLTTWTAGFGIGAGAASGQGDATGDGAVDGADLLVWQRQFGQSTPVVSPVTNRIPAEWERHDSTWMQWPKGEEVSYRDNFAGIIRILQGYEQVNLVVESPSAQTQAAQFLHQRGVPLGNIAFHIMPYDWSWMRDNGAIWVEGTDANGKKTMDVQDWGFDGWGGDGGPSPKDDAVPIHVARIEGVGYKKVDVVLEKGTLEFNGKDAVITSWTVLHDRNPQMSKPQLESALKENFGVTKVVWLEGASPDDLTDGHVDGIARFINETTVVVNRYADQSDADAALFERAATTIRGAGFDVVRLDVPGYVQYRGAWLPANYANYLVANGVVIASSYGNAQFDSAAKAQLQQLFPTRDIVMTDTRELWYNGGAVHCVTNDQPLLRQGTARPATTSPVSVAPFRPMADSQSVVTGATTTAILAPDCVDVNSCGIISPMEMLTIANVLNRQSDSMRQLDAAFSEFEKLDLYEGGLVTPPDAILIGNLMQTMTRMV